MVLSAMEVCVWSASMECDAQLCVDCRVWTQEAVDAECAQQLEHGQDDLWDHEQRCREWSWEQGESDESEDLWQPLKRWWDVNKGERPMACVLHSEMKRACLGTTDIAHACLRMIRRGRGDVAVALATCFELKES